MKDRTLTKDEFVNVIVAYCGEGRRRTSENTYDIITVSPEPMLESRMWRLLRGMSGKGIDHWPKLKEAYKKWKFDGISILESCKAL